MCWSRIIVVITLLMSALSSFAQIPGEVKDTCRVYTIDSSAIVIARTNNSPVRGDLTKGVSFDVKMMDSFPKVLGNADPLKYIQSLPGVSTNNDWESGVRIQGCEQSQSAVMLCEVPVYGTGHIMGLFSVFNPGHFKHLLFNTSTRTNKIGGELNMETSDTVAKAFHGEANIGPVSAQGTITFPTGKHSSLILSARRSFIDVFFKGLFKMDDNQMNYIIRDYNASWLCKLGKYDDLDINAYYGTDWGSASMGGVNDMDAMWGNALGNIRWRHNKNKVKGSTQLYASGFFCNSKVAIANENGTIKDDLMNFGLRSDWNVGGLRLDADVSIFNIQPQIIDIHTSSVEKNSDIRRQRSISGTLRADYTFRPGDWTLRPGLGLSGFIDIDEDFRKFYPDPFLEIGYNMYRGGRINFEVGIRHQYYFMTGITNNGFPIEYWLSCGRYSDPQEADYATLGYDVDFFNGSWSAGAQIYGKKLSNQVEYKGDMMDIIYGEYDIRKLIMVGNGYNYGLSILLRKNSGRLTGWLSYNFGRAIRSFDNPYYSGTCPSSYERLHELNAVVSYKTGRWEFGANGIYASGNPYTPATGAYILNNEIHIQYGERNSLRLAPYIRVDASVTFHIRQKGRFRDAVNISCQNATARNNQLMTSLKEKDGKFAYRPVFIVIPVLPSINYQCSF